MFPTTAMFRNASHSLRSSKRSMSSNASSSSKKAIPAPGQLPHHKMRALVSLYHQAGSFITPDTLSDAIDNAFIRRRTDDSNLKHHGDEEPFPSLLARFNARRNYPSIGDVEIAPRDPYDMSTTDGTWSYGAKKREAEATHALFGIAPGGKPDVEVLEEEADRIQGKRVPPQA